MVDRPQWLRGDGEMAALVHAHDWGATSVGPIETWPAELRLAAALVLDNRFPAALVWGPELVTIYNDGFRPILNGKHNALGRSFSDIWAEAWDEIGPIAERAFAGQSTFIEDYSLLIDRSGQPEQAFFTFSYSPVRAADGTVLGMIDTVVETTAHARAKAALLENQERLQESEARSRTLVEGIAQATWETDAAGAVVADSPSWRAYTGQSFGEWVDYGWLDAIYPEDRAYAERQWRDAIAAQRNLDAEFRLRASDGAWRWTNVRAAPLLNTDGTIRKWVGMNIDIDARKSAEAALRDSEMRFRAFVKASSDLVYRMSPDWSEMRQLEGRAFLPDTDEPSENWLDRYIHPDDQAVVYAAIAQAIQTRSMFELEHRVIRVDGSLGWTLSRAVPILAGDGQVVEWLGAASDISPRKEAEAVRARAEQALRESEERYLGLYNAIDQGFCTVEVAFDPNDHPTDYRFVEVSPAFEAQTGIKDAAGKWMRDIAADQDEIWFEAYGRVALTGEPARFEAGSGPLGRWWSVYAYRIGNPVQRTIAVLFSDITARKRAEDALRESEERLRQFGEASQDVLWIRDAETFQWSYLTPAFEAIYGLERKAALSGDNMANWAELIVPEDRERAVRSIERVRDGELATFEYRVRRPLDGQLRWLRDTDFPIQDQTGRVAHIGGVGHDVTAMKEAEEALAAAEQRQRQLLENIPQLVWRAVDDGHWTWASPQWTEYTGRSDEASRGRGWLDALHPGDRDAAIAAWDRAQTDGLFQVEYRLLHAESGHYRWFTSRGTPILWADGSRAEWLGTSTDIDEQVRAREFLTSAGQEMEQRVADRTAELQQALNTLHRETLEHEQAEERLRQSEKLKAVGQLTGGIAHDFNNMLQGITGALALVRTRLAQGRVADAKAYIEPAERAASRAGALTHRLLAFSRQQTLAPEPVNLDQIARSMEDMIRRTVGPSVQVELKSADGHWLVLCDPNQIESALLNLCVNARDAMPKGGWLTISTEERILSADEVANFDDLQPGRYAAIAVTDTGSGMPPHVVERLFEPFFTTKPLGQGTGLGLSQIYGFMRQSGGLVQIETVVGKGTTVRLCLPFYEMNSEEQFAPPTTGKTLLLVEDEHDVRAMLADQLRDIGYRVLEADTADAALRVLSTGIQVDLLVTDVGLRGGINGRQLADSVREQARSLPVIFITGFAGAETLLGEDVIHKPFETTILSQLIGERLS